MFIFIFPVWAGFKLKNQTIKRIKRIKRIKQSKDSNNQKNQTIKRIKQSRRDGEGSKSALRRS